MPTDTTLIATKLQRPLLTGPCIDRGRLMARLGAGLAAGCRLTLVVGPAGFGKTTLVASWLASFAESGPNPASVACAWLSLEAADDEPRRLLRYLLAAFRQLGPELDSALRPLLAGALPPEDVLTRLVNALAAHGQPCVLVLDDGHHLRHQEVINLLGFLLDHSPPSFHLVICSREDPLLPLARLRARRQLLEVRQSDLRCSVDEAEAFLREGMGLELSKPAVEALNRRTEGWFAGLQLAALSLQQSDDPAQFVQTFAGSERYMLDYLLDEVYSGQPAAIRELLLRCAVLPRFSATLCDALLDVPGPEECQPIVGSATTLLAQVERANLFLVPLDDARHWYRFHHLFADLLHHRLRIERGTAFVAALHRAASMWFEAEGLLAEAAVAAARGVMTATLAQPAPEPYSGGAALVEPLSERELEVLQFLVEEPGYDVIARQLVVSPNTVKSHVKHIYAKLAVGNRRQAIAQARALGLLPEHTPW